MTPATSRVAARGYWREHASSREAGPRPRQPTLVLVSGVPLVGKTTLAHHLVDHLDAQTLHVENDRLRALVVEAMDRQEPVFDEQERQATYAAARRLIERGLEAGLHVVHDATNLRESDRGQAYAIADEHGAPARAVFVDAPPEVLQRRAREEGPAAEQALDALGDRDPGASASTRPHRVLDGTREPQANVARLLDEEPFALLQRTARA